MNFGKFSTDNVEPISTNGLVSKPVSSKTPSFGSCAPKKIFLGTDILSQYSAK
jgi:hypothetical protein